MINKYFQKHKERLGKEARERYQNLPEEVRDRKFKKAKTKKDIKIFLKKKKKKNKKT